MISATYTLWLREVVRFFRQKNRVAAALLTPFVFWLIIGSGFQSFGLDHGFEFTFAGVLVMVVLFTGVFSSISVIQDRHEGFLQAVFVSPAPRLAIALGPILGGTTIAVFQAVLFFMLGPIFSIWPSFTAVGALVIISIGLIALGFTFAWRMESVQGFHAIMNLVLMPMWILSGSWFPIPENPDSVGQSILRWVMQANPLTYGVATLRHAMGETVEFPSPTLAVAVTVAFAVVMILIAGWLTGLRPKGGAA